MRRFGGPNAPGQDDLTEESIEAFFIHKLSLLLDQKSEARWRQGKIIEKHEENKVGKSKTKDVSESAEVDVV